MQKMIKCAFINALKKTVKPTHIFLTAVLLLVPALQQAACAAMIGTELLLTSNRNPEPRADLGKAIPREKILAALVAGGIDPQEAEARIDSLCDEEIELISEKLADLPAGGNAVGFVVITGIVVLIVLIIIESTSDVRMFPRLDFRNWF